MIVLLEDYEYIRDRLSEELSGSPEACSDLIDLILKVSDYVLRQQPQLKERVNDIMGGKLLELASERNRRIGRTEGIAMGRSEGILEIITNMLKEKLPIETIATVSKYSVEDILKIKNSIE